MADHLRNRINAFTGFGRRQPHLLLVASTGGHLTQLSRLADYAGVSEHATWVTFDSPQSRSMLAGANTVWVDYVAPRDVQGVLRAKERLQRELDPHAFDGVVSTGAAVALSGFFWAREHGIPRAHRRYIESVSRTRGPSLTGRITKSLRLADTFSQHDAWASDAWPLTHSVLHGFEREALPARRGEDAPLKILVTLGTIRPYRFDRLVDRVLAIAAPDDSIVWQLGATKREDGLPGEVHELMSADALLDAARTADVVITHSGVGTILQLLDEQISPVVVPRRPQHREHVDDHQSQIWQLLAEARIAHPVEVENLTRAELVNAASHRTVAPGVS